MHVLCVGGRARISADVRDRVRVRVRAQKTVHEHGGEGVCGAAAGGLGAHVHPLV